MSTEFIGLQEWLASPAGRYLRAWEQAQFDSAVADLFGYHALQLGQPSFDTLAQNRMPHRWLGLMATEHPAPQADLPALARAALLTDFAALPFPENSLDLVALPHTLENHPDPHSTLREVARVLVPEGRVLIAGFNPISWWGMSQRCRHGFRRLGLSHLFLPMEGDYLGAWRLRDWLQLLGLEVQDCHFGCYRPAVQSPAWLERMAWLDAAGPRWWPILGASYFVVAVKRVRGVRLLTNAWKQPATRAAQALPVARHVNPNRTRCEPD